MGVRLFDKSARVVLGPMVAACSNVVRKCFVAPRTVERGADGGMGFSRPGLDAIDVNTLYSLALSKPVGTNRDESTSQR